MDGIQVESVGISSRWRPIWYLYGDVNVDCRSARLGGEPLMDDLIRRRPNHPGAILRAHYVEPRGVGVGELAAAIDVSRSCRRVIAARDPHDVPALLAVWSARHGYRHARAIDQRRRAIIGRAVHQRWGAPIAAVPAAIAVTAATATTAAMVTAAAAMGGTTAAVRTTTAATAAATSLGCVCRRGEGAQANHGEDRHANRERPGQNRSGSGGRRSGHFTLPG